VGAPTRAHALGMGPGLPRSNIIGRQIALRLVHGCLIADFTASTGSEVVDRRRAPRTRAHAPPSTPRGIASQGGVESPVARGHTGSAVTCSRQCISNFGGCVALPRVANQRGGADAAAQGEVHRCSRLRPRLARRYVHFHSVAMARSAARSAAHGEVHRCSRLRPRLTRRYMHFHSVAMARRAARSWRVWRSGERRGAAVGGVALAPMRLRRARCIIASSSGRAWRGGTCTGTRT